MTICDSVVLCMQIWQLCGLSVIVCVRSISSRMEEKCCNRLEISELLCLWDLPIIVGADSSSFWVPMGTVHIIWNCLGSTYSLVLAAKVSLSLVNCTGNYMYHLLFYNINITFCLRCLSYSFPMILSRDYEARRIHWVGVCKVEALCLLWGRDGISEEHIPKLKVHF
jgi:hypothetical protein